MVPPCSGSSCRVSFGTGRRSGRFADHADSVPSGGARRQLVSARRRAKTCRGNAASATGTMAYQAWHTRRAPVLINRRAARSATTAQWPRAPLPRAGISRTYVRRSLSWRAMPNSTVPQEPIQQRQRLQPCRASGKEAPMAPSAASLQPPSHPKARQGSD